MREEREEGKGEGEKKVEGKKIEEEKPGENTDKAAAQAEPKPLITQSYTHSLHWQVYGSSCPTFDR